MHRWIQLNPPPTQLGSTSQGLFDIVNCGDGPLTIGSVQLTSGVFALVSTNPCVGTLAAGNSCTVAYTFTPKATGMISATVLIGSDAPMANSETITGDGTAPKLYLPGGNSYAFPPQVLGTSGPNAVILIANAGTAPLVVDTTRTTLTGPFSVNSTSCGIPVPPSSNSACTYTIAFNPTTAGTANGTLTLFSNDLTTPTVSIAITGTALDSYSVPTITRLDAPTVSLDGGTATVNIIGTNFFPASTVSINSVSVPVQSSTNTTISIKFDPAILGAMGEYPVQVTNPTPGGGSATARLTAYRLLKVTATQIIYEPKSKMLYLAVPATASTNPNTIIPLDPAIGARGTPIPVQTNPARLALSDDSHYLYIAFYYTYKPNGVIQRIDLTTGAVDRTFTLPGSSDGVIDMHVVPGSPKLLVASLSRAASPGENGAALF
jgi:hypothetical protein